MVVEMTLHTPVGLIPEIICPHAQNAFMAAAWGVRVWGGCMVLAQTQC
jgi:hypothetical protein